MPDFRSTTNYIQIDSIFNSRAILGGWLLLQLKKHRNLAPSPHESVWQCVNGSLTTDTRRSSRPAGRPRSDPRSGPPVFDDQVSNKLLPSQLLFPTCLFLPVVFLSLSLLLSVVGLTGPTLKTRPSADPHWLLQSSLTPNDEQQSLKFLGLLWNIPTKVVMEEVSV